MAVPFVLLSHPTGVFGSRAGGVMKMAEEAHTKYVDIFREIEQMIDDHSKRDTQAPQLPFIKNTNFGES